mmetsp:Transcript_14765/g.31685  ORF Transcript_14765/g.31685 Transcript_14765/m.31685 type:complete len:293 (-) Transcript_14765:1065-1943(-)
MSASSPCSSLPNSPTSSSFCFRVITSCSWCAFVMNSASHLLTSNRLAFRTDSLRPAAPSLCLFWSCKAPCRLEISFLSSLFCAWNFSACAFCSLSLRWNSRRSMASVMLSVCSCSLTSAAFAGPTSSCSRRWLADSPAAGAPVAAGAAGATGAAGGGVEALPAAGGWLMLATCAWVGGKRLAPEPVLDGWAVAGREGWVAPAAALGEAAEGVLAGGGLGGGFVASFGPAGGVAEVEDGRDGRRKILGRLLTGFEPGAAPAALACPVGVASGFFCCCGLGLGLVAPATSFFSD